MLAPLNLNFKVMLDFTSSCIDISSPYEVDVVNVLVISYLFTHREYAEQH